MSEELPDNWVWTTLDRVALIQGGIQKQQKRRPVNNRFPFLRVANVGRGTLDLTDVHEIELFEGELDRFALRDGDLLVVEGNGSPDQLGRAAVWGGEIPNCVHQNHLIRVRPLRAVNPAFLSHLWNSPVVADQLRIVASSTSGLHTLSTSKLKQIRIPLPPLAEQQRIVELIDDHASRLDAGIDLLNAALTRCRLFRRSWLWEITHRVEGDIVSLDSIAEVRLGRQRSPKNHAGESMYPYLRAANVGWSGLKLDDVKEMNFTDRELGTYRLELGDILLSEASGSASEVGKPALWRGEIENCCFQNTLIRVRPVAARPEFLLHYLRAEALAGRFIDRSRGVGIHHIGAATLAAWKVHLPSDSAQAGIVEQINAIEPALASLEASISAQIKRGRQLRNALLRAALAGRIARQDPTDEPVKELLANLASDRAGTRALTPRRRAAVTSESSLTAATGVQEELPL